MFRIHHLNHQAVEQEVKKNSLIMIGVFAFAYMLNFASPLIAQILKIQDSFKVHPFLFHGKKITGENITTTIYDITYVDYAAKCAGWVVVIVGLIYILPRYRDVLKPILLLFIGYTVEYAVIYNDPVFWYGIVPVMYSTIAVICFILMFVIRYLKE